MLNKLGSKLVSSLRRFGLSEQAASAIEFAMVGPVFILIMGVTIESGVMLTTEYVLQSAVTDAARLVRTGQAQTSPLSKAAFKTKICNTANLIMNCTGAVTVYVNSDTNFQNLKNNLPDFLTIGPSVAGSPVAADCYKTGAPSQPAAVVATYDWYFKVWGMSVFGNIGGGIARRLVGFAIFQNEPFPPVATTTCT